MQENIVDNFNCDSQDADILGLFGRIQEFIYIKSIYKIKDFMDKAKLLKVNFNGGALIKTNNLKDDFVIDDYDLFIVGEDKEQLYLASKKKLIDLGFKIDSQSNGTLTTKQTTIFKDSNGTKFDFLLKRGEVFKKISGGAFDVDLVYLEIKKEDAKSNKIRVNLKNSFALESLDKKITIFHGHTDDYERVLKRILVLSAKYDIENFVIYNKTINVSNDSNLTKDNIKKIKEILPKTTNKGRASVLMKFFSILYRVSKPLDYIRRVNNSHLLDEGFPELSKILKNDDFISFLGIEQRSSTKKLNNELNTFNTLVFFSKDKNAFIKECKEILSEIELDKQTFSFRVIYKKINSLCKEKGIEK